MNVVIFFLIQNFFLPIKKRAILNTNQLHTLWARIHKLLFYSRAKIIEIIFWKICNEHVDIFVLPWRLKWLLDLWRTRGTLDRLMKMTLESTRDYSASVRHRLLMGRAYEMQKILDQMLTQRWKCSKKIEIFFCKILLL